MATYTFTVPKADLKPWNTRHGITSIDEEKAHLATHYGTTKVATREVGRDIEFTATGPEEGINRLRSSRGERPAEAGHNLTLTLTAVHAGIHDRTSHIATRPATHDIDLYAVAKEALDRNLPTTAAVRAELKRDGILIDQDEAHR